MAMLAQVSGLFRLVPEKAFPIGAVGVVAADAGHGAAGTLGVVLFIDRVT